MTLPAIDVSNHQGAGIQWPLVNKAGIPICLAKISEGAGADQYDDPDFATNFNGMVANGISPAGFHFCHPEANTAQAEFAYMQQCLAGDGITPPPGFVFALDAEDDGSGAADYSAWYDEFAQLIQGAYGCWPLLYSNLDYLNRHNIGGSAVIENCGLWIAAPGVTSPTLPPGWGFWAAWQDSWSGTVPGIPGQVDIDVVNVSSVAQWQLYGVPAQQPTPPPSDPCAAVEAQLAAATATITTLQGKIAAAVAALS